MQGCVSQPTRLRFCWRVGLGGDAAGVQDVWVSPETVLGRFVCELLPVDIRTRVASGWISVFPGGLTFRGFFDTPFGSLEEWQELDVVDVLLLRTENWPDVAAQASGLCWRDLPVSDVPGRMPLLEELAKLPQNVDGVRKWTTVSNTVYFVFDERFIFLELPRYGDVFFSAKNDLTIDGTPVTVRNTHLFADVHTPLQEVRVGDSCDVHLKCAQYTAMHLCLELDTPVARLPCNVSMTLCVGMLQSAARRNVSQLGFVSPDGSWALKDGCVFFNMHPPRFLSVRVTHSFKCGFSCPAPHLFEYRLLAESDDAPESVFFEFHREDMAGVWTAASNPYCDLRALRIPREDEISDVVTSFRMEARRLTGDFSQ